MKNSSDTIGIPATKFSYYCIELLLLMPINPVTVSCNFFSGFPRLNFHLHNCHIVSAVLVGHAIAGLLGTPLVLALGRDSLCYVLAVLTLLWTMGWWLLVRDSPAEHPRLSAEQRHHLQRAIGPGVSARNAVSCVKQTGRRTIKKLI
jgi:hypothetical protein